MIDLSTIPLPDAVEIIDYEVLLNQRKEAYIALYPADEQPAVRASLQFESDRVLKLLQESTYRELLLRQRVNEAVRAVMLAHARHKDLDNIGTTFMVERMLVSPGNPDAVPPVPPVYEDDERYRLRIQLSFEAYSTAGPRGAYVYHALSASADVLDADASSPLPGIVNVAILSRNGTGLADQALLDKVSRALSAEEVRPMNDQVLVQSAVVNEYIIEAELKIYSGPDSDVVMSAANKSASDYVKKMHRLGADVTLSGLYAALHVNGVQNVNLIQPAASVICDWNQAGYCREIRLRFGGLGD